MNRKAEIFFDAITLLREDLVEDAQNIVFRKKQSGWKRFGSLAACVMLVLSLGLVAALPKGCGGSGPVSTDMNTSSGAPEAPAEMPPSVGEDAAGGSMGGSTTDTAPRPPAGEDGLDYGQGPVQFTAQVLEVLEDGLLVEPFDSLPEKPERVRIPTAGLENLPEFYPGGVVKVACGTVAQEDGEAVAKDVTELELVEP